MIDIYTDGSYKRGIGGWGAVIIMPRQNKVQLCGRLATTGVQRMELTAIIKALLWFDDQITATIHTDSRFVLNGVDLLDEWRDNDWRHRDMGRVDQEDLWRTLDCVASYHQLTWHHVRGHRPDGDTHQWHNHLAHLLANQARRGFFT